MRFGCSQVFTVAIFGFLLPGCHKSPERVPHVNPSMELVLANGLEGDLKTGLEILDRIPKESMSETDRAICTCLQNRFEKAQDPDLGIQSPMVRDIAKIYLDYWRKCLLKTQSLQKIQCGIVLASHCVLGQIWKGRRPH